MKFLRALTLLCFGFGLFVQVAAQAAAAPQMESAEVMDCAEMAQGMSERVTPEEQSPDQGGPCGDMTLGCLIAMNCLPPLALTDDRVVDTPLPVIGITYLAAIADRLEGRPMRPESPPPQLDLTA